MPSLVALFIGKPKRTPSVSGLHSLSMRACPIRICFRCAVFLVALLAQPVGHGWLGAISGPVSMRCGLALTFFLLFHLGLQLQITIPHMLVAGARCNLTSKLDSVTGEARGHASVGQARGEFCSANRLLTFPIIFIQKVKKLQTDGRFPASLRHSNCSYGSPSFASHFRNERG